MTEHPEYVVLDTGHLTNVELARIAYALHELADIGGVLRSPAAIDWTEALACRVQIVIGKRRAAKRQAVDREVSEFRAEIDAGVEMAISDIEVNGILAGLLQAQEATGGHETDGEA
jgi:hypothetical protein